jgi:translation initiation factor 4G
MTSTVSQQNQISTPISTADPSYASVAGASRRLGGMIAGGINPLVVDGSSAPASHNGRPLSISPANGRPNITPAIPVTAVPTIVHSSLNGAANEHARKSSVTISANAPASHIACGGLVGRAKAIPQFGFKDSPAIAHSTPQLSASAPIPISGNHRVASPAHSSSPIQQLSASGGRPPHNSPPPNQMMFRSFPGNGDVSSLILKRFFFSFLRDMVTNPSLHTPRSFSIFTFPAATLPTHYFFWVIRMLTETCMCSAI